MEEARGEKMIPYIAHESEVARLERVSKRLWILVIIVFVALIGTNAYWIWNESQYVDEVVTETYTAETDTGGTAIVNGEGSVIINGESNKDTNNQNENP